MLFGMAVPTSFYIFGNVLSFWGEPERAPHSWGEPERAPHSRDSCGRRRDRDRDRGPRCLSTLRHLTFCARGRGMVWAWVRIVHSVRSGLSTSCTWSMAHVHETETEDLSQRREAAARAAETAEEREVRLQRERYRAAEIEGAR